MSVPNWFGRTFVVLGLVVVLLNALTHACGAGEILVSDALVRFIDEAEIPALEAGILQEVAVHDGTKVEAEQILARQVSRDAELLVARHQREVAVARLQAENRVKIQAAEAAMRVAETELARAKESLAKVPKSVSPAELDRLQLAVTQARLTVDQSRFDQELARLAADLKQSELAIAERNLQRHQVLAPFGGIVAQVYRRRGEWVEPGEKVLRLVRTDRLRVEAFLPAANVSTDLTDRPARVLVREGNHPEAAVAGNVTFASPEADPVTGQVRIIVEVANSSGKLRPGSKATLIISVP